ncbi:hypothetical protein C7446_2204 [Kushneria sinocarnis]|uniref:Uncharacterized protein n=1 Tax=Kushneria sinocarnis TaxID=595502 RepID=A0A420WVB4_9GAMM|nr:DciA family protein [Kushneria sinocarnis]RKR02489.1 hypothetical protein C7446_2204 [Kushneria sinocarnis]
MSIKAKAGRAQSAAKLFTHQGTLAPLIRTAQLLAEAQQQLDAHLPEELHGHVAVGGYREGRLTLITDRAVWLTWLRFEQRRLLTLLNQIRGLETLQGLQFKVRPIRPLYQPVHQPRHLPAEAAEQLRMCASDTSDRHLRRALERLASHGDRNPDSS